MIIDAGYLRVIGLERIISKAAIFAGLLILPLAGCTPSFTPCVGYIVESGTPVMPPGEGIYFVVCGLKDGKIMHRGMALEIRMVNGYSENIIVASGDELVQTSHFTATSKDGMTVGGGVGGGWPVYVYDQNHCDVHMLKPLSPRSDVLTVGLIPDPHGGDMLQYPIKNDDLASAAELFYMGEYTDITFKLELQKDIFRPSVGKWETLKVFLEFKPSQATEPK